MSQQVKLYDIYHFFRYTFNSTQRIYILDNLDHLFKFKCENKIINEYDYKCYKNINILFKLLDSDQITLQQKINMIREIESPKYNYYIIQIDWIFKKINLNFNKILDIDVESLYLNYVCPINV